MRNWSEEFIVARVIFFFFFFLSFPPYYICAYTYRFEFPCEFAVF